MILGCLQRVDLQAILEGVRTLHIHSGNLFGGVEAILVTLARSEGLYPRMCSDFALCFEGRLSRELEATDRLPRRLGAVRISRPWSALQARRRLRDLLRRERYETVVCHSVWSQVLFAPVVHQVSEAAQVLWLHDAAQGRHWLERCASRVPPHGLICNSRFTQSTAGILYSQARPEIPNGIPIETIYPLVAPPEPLAGEEREGIRRRIGATPERVVIVQVSRMEPWKGQENLLRALARIRPSQDWEAWIVGGAQRPKEEEYLRGLQALSKSLGISERVRFLGQRSDVPRLLGAADLFCQPNRSPEPFGIAFIEALDAGLPVVGARLGATPEIVGEENGALVSPGAEFISGLASALEETIARIGRPEDREAFRIRNPKRARALCDPRSQLAAMHEFFERVRDQKGFQKRKGPG